MIRYLSAPFKWFFKLEAASGLLLLISAIVALILSNSDYSSLYFKILETYFFLGINNIGIKMNVLHWINDALMAAFFFFVTLEIKREFLQGELSNRKQALLPIIAAVGGMLVPALIYIFINFENPETLRGWAIPSATDIAFSLGVLSLLGSRVPLSLKVFLTALAIIDDLGAIVIIAFFYTGDLNIIYLTLLLLVFITLLTKIEHKISPYVAFGIMPLFALANAGVSLDGVTFNSLLSPIPLGILLGLFVGKQVGVFLFSIVSIKLKIAQMPNNANWAGLYGVGILTGIGFTMSLFIGNLAFVENNQYIDGVKIGVLTGSLLSTLVGYFLLLIFSKK